MRYQLKCYDATPNFMMIEVNKEILDITSVGIFANIVNTTKGQYYGHSKLLRDLCMIDGVSEVWTNRYEVNIIKASDLFDWANILPGLLYVLCEYLDPNGKIEEASPKKVIVVERAKKAEYRPLIDRPFDDDPEDPDIHYD